MSDVETERAAFDPAAASESAERPPDPARALPGPPATPMPSLLPRGWGPFLLALTIVLLALGYWIGLRARPPVHAVEPAEVETEAGPASGR